ncbi:MULTISPECIES: 23S rRNA pseudouridine(1911/1915/1917) synthase RluD [Acidithiobacillus]|uniref:23S rRNA pseudouridine(1911/1915/1917) synthase RluD n=1 Tax=Acidithiobacillus ferruginosus TaxID=3063951 RepID=A0ACD5IIP4_9PROT|nr:23S rRNA pseudouridine(1911/1915/1917) synthase RluD [Acidithiobacillus ferruginosus]MBU2812772.1 23S rRNA pseudouridine(1911/1915/1917) synthase RluD [Acidithiobacillus ferruginosus]
MSDDSTGLPMILPEEQAGERLDTVLSQLLPETSRSRIQALLRDGRILVDGAPERPSARVRGGEQVMVDWPQIEPSNWLAEDLPLHILHEDADILVVHKPAGQLTHPGAGHADGTLVNGVLAHVPENAYLPRGGIVHRLDKDTTGLLVVAKTEMARQSLIDQLGDHTMHREYLALVMGAMTGGGRVDAPIGRHAQDRLRMTVRDDGRPAQTDYRLVERFPRHSYLRLRLATGRTHQIRVHMTHIGHPLVGDPVYGGRMTVPKGLDEAALARWRQFRRQALHACRLRLYHPASGDLMTWESPLPDDMTELLALLRGARDGD